jgi:DNA invertase Pin-like site-specific DNA recombinase
MLHQQFVAYYRVSTARQGRSGLRLDAQKQAVSLHLKDAKLIHEFTEVESGRCGHWAAPQVRDILRRAG